MLDVMHNQISEIPEEIENLTSLQQLKIKGNPIKALSKRVNDMTSLKILICELKVRCSFVLADDLRTDYQSMNCVIQL